MGQIFDTSDIPVGGGYSLGYSYTKTADLSATIGADIGGVAFNADGTKMFVTGDSADAVHEYALSAPWDAGSFTFTQDFSLGTTAAAGLAFNTDGTKMFVVDSHSTGQDVNEYALSTGFDVSTASFVDAFSVAGQDSTPLGLAFNADGTKMFISGSGGSPLGVRQYTLSTGFDVSTASYDGLYFNTAPEGGSRYVTFNADGTLMFTTHTASGGDAYQYALSEPFNIASARYTGVSLDLSAQSTSPNDIFFSADGSKMYIVDAGARAIDQYEDTREAPDLSGARYNGISLSVADNGVQSLQNIALSPDGTKLFAVDVNNDVVAQYTLQTANDLSTMVYDGVSYDVSGQETNPFGIAFNPDGTKMFVVGTVGSDVNEYTLSTGFDLSSTVTFIDSFSVASQDANSRAIAFNTDGTKMFVVGFSNDRVYQYSLSTGFDVSTASYDSVSYSIAAQDTLPHGISFNSDGTKMFITGASSNFIYEYTLSIGFDLSSTVTFIDALNVSAQIGTPRGVAFSADGTKLFAPDSGDEEVHQYTLSTGFDVSTASYDSVSRLLRAQAEEPHDIAFNADGTKMFVLSDIADRVFEYTLATPYNIPTASYSSSSFSVAAQDTSPTGIAFNTDGTKMFMSGDSGNRINEYALSTAFDVSTAAFVDFFSVSLQTVDPRGVSFNADGTKMFVVSSGTAFEYALSTAFDLSTASYVDSFNISTQESASQALAFNADGTKMYVIGTSGDDVNEYSLTTAFDVSTASSTRAFSVASQSANPTGLAFSNDFTKMFVCDLITDTVYQYTV